MRPTIVYVHPHLMMRTSATNFVDGTRDHVCASYTTLETINSLDLTLNALSKLQ